MGSIRELIDYILNVFKFWITVQPWETAIRTRFGKNQKQVGPGCHFRIPLFDSFYIQCNRLRVVSFPMQTLTSKDLQTVTINGCAGYEILDIVKLYNNMLYPEQTISNIIMSEIADYMYTNNVKEINPALIEANVLTKLDLDKYGISVKYFKLINFAVVKTFRLIQDHSWISEGIKLTDAK